MSGYVMKIGFDDHAEATLVQLAGMSLAEAEQFVAQVRFDVAEAKTMDAPVVEEISAGTAGTAGSKGSAGAGIDIVLDPRRVISIDLQEATEGGIERSVEKPGDGPVDLG